MNAPATPSPRSNISKSVARAFEVLELFREIRQPLTLAEVRTQLDMPQPSARALLGNLVDIGYLNYATESKTYFPTMRLARLGDWIAAGLLAGGNISQVIDDIGIETGETTSISIINDVYLEVLYVKVATHPVALQLQPGRGELLWRTAAGRTLLSQLTEDECAKLMRAMAGRDGNPKRRREILALASEIAAIRRRGHYVGYDIYLQGVGTVCVPVRVGNQQAVIAVAGIRDRIQANEQQLIASVREQLDNLP